jgi:hypothetical protein
MPARVVPVGEASGGARWTRIALPSKVAFSAGIATDSGFIAFGSDPSLVDSPSLWRSEDGVAWRLIDAPRAFDVPNGPGLRESVVLALARHEEDLVAVGTVQLADTSRGDAAAWFSSDAGQTWRRAGGTGLDDAEMTSVAWGAAGWVAVGTDGYPGASTQASGVKGMASWTSRDGMVWTRARPTAEMAWAMPNQVVFTSTAYIAAGSIVPGPLTAQPIWSSADGVRWRAVDVGAKRAHIAGSAADGWVLAGRSRNDGIAIWRLGADQRWDQAAITTQASESASIAAVERLGGVWLAVGTDENAAGAPVLAVWFSDDGLTWARARSIPAFDGAYNPSIIRGVDRLIVLAAQDDPQSTSFEADEWIVTSP